jgi:antitoxin (DNA-binding transcriptional repressor) of toxin-antitoxin stability system
MMQITLTEFSQHLPVYLEQVLAGQELLLMAQDKIVARLLPQVDHQQLARAQLQNLQQQCQIGDVISPLAEVWEVQT